MCKKAGIRELELAALAGRLSREAIGHITTGRKLTLDKAAPEFAEWMKSVGKADKAIYNTLSTLNEWLDAAHLRHLPPSAITEKHIAQWINAKHAVAKGKTRMVKLAALRTFFRFCSAKGWIAGNPSALVKVDYSVLSHEQKETSEKECFTIPEVNRVATEAEKRGSVFWEFATRISNEIGLRLGDICQLEWACFSKPGYITVWTDKRDKRVSVPISERIQLLSSWIPVASTTHLFPEQRALALDPKKRVSLSVQFKRLAEAAGVQGKSFHALRHTCIARWAKEGKTLESIAKDMDHPR